MLSRDNERCIQGKLRKIYQAQQVKHQLHLSAMKYKLDLNVCIFCICLILVYEFYKQLLHRGFVASAN